MRHSLLFFTGAIAEAGGWENFRTEFAVRLPVLCYHNVGEKTKRSWSLLTISPAVLEKQMHWLARHGYTAIGASDWLEWIRCGKQLPAKPVLITFDDGYSELVQTAIPVLTAYNFRAILFLVSQHIGTTSTWDDSLGYASRPLMGAEILSLPKALEIGSHTRTHRDLRKLSDAELRIELEGSRAELTSLMGTPIRFLAYPYGFLNNTVRKSAEQYYELSFGCQSGLNGWRTDPQCLHRMFVHPNRLNFALQVKWGIDLNAMLRFVPERLATLRRITTTSLTKSVVRHVVPGNQRPQNNAPTADDGLSQQLS